MLAFTKPGSATSKLLSQGSLGPKKISKIKSTVGEDLNREYLIETFLNWKQYSKILALIASFAILAYLISVTNQFNFTAILDTDIIDSPGSSSIEVTLLPIVARIMYWLLIILILILLLLIIHLIYLLIKDVKKDELLI